MKINISQLIAKLDLYSYFLGLFGSLIPLNVCSFLTANYSLRPSPLQWLFVWLFISEWFKKNKLHKSVAQCVSESACDMHRKKGHHFTWECHTRCSLVLICKRGNQNVHVSACALSATKRQRVLQHLPGKSAYQLC